MAVTGPSGSAPAGAAGQRSLGSGAGACGVTRRMPYSMRGSGTSPPPRRPTDAVAERAKVSEGDSPEVHGVGGHLDDLQRLEGLGVVDGHRGTAGSDIDLLPVARDVDGVARALLDVRDRAIGLVRHVDDAQVIHHR